MAREKWSSRTGFLIAGIGSVVGPGNVWRLPYIVGQNGGGVFLILYLIVIFLQGLPLMILWNSQLAQLEVAYLIFEKRGIPVPLTLVLRVK